MTMAPITTESLWQRLKKLRRQQLSYLPADEAREYGFDLEPDWAVKIDWDETETPKYTYVSPKGWQFKDLTYDDKDELLEYTALSPEGETYTKAELEAQQAQTKATIAAQETEAKEYQALLPKLEPFKTPEGKYDVARAVEFIPREQLVKLFGEENVPLPTERGAEPTEFEPQGISKATAAMLEKLYPTEAAPPVPQDVLTFAQQDTAGFLADLRAKGRTADTENILRTVMADSVHADTGQPFTFTEIDELVNDVFEGAPQITDVQQTMMKALPLVVKPTTLDWATQYFSKNPDKLRRELITAGMNLDTVKLVKQIYPQITTQGLTDYFSPDVPEVTAKVSGEELIRQEAIARGETSYWYEPEKAWKLVSEKPEPFLSRMPFEKQLEKLGKVPPFKQLGEAGKIVVEAVNVPLFYVAGVGVSAGDIGNLVALGFGAYQGAKSLMPLLEGLGNKSLQTALNLGLDKWIARMSRGVPPERLKAVQNALYNFIARDKIWLQQRATDNMLRKMGRGVNATSATNQAVEDTIKDVETRFTALVPRGTQTGALAFGGLPPISKASWDAMPITQRVALAISKGLQGTVGSKPFETLSHTELTALQKGAIVPGAEPKGIKPEEVIPVTPEVTKEGIATESFDLTLSELYADITIPTKELSTNAQLTRIARIEKLATDIEKATKGIRTKFKGDWYVSQEVDNISEIIEEVKRETNPSEKTILFSNLKQQLHLAVINHPGMGAYYSGKLGVDVGRAFEAASLEEAKRAIPKAAPVAPEVTKSALNNLLAHLREAPLSKSSETYLRKSFGDEVLKQAYDTGLVVRSPKDIYTISLKGQEVIKTVPRGKVNLYGAAKRILEEGITIEPSVIPTAEAVMPEAVTPPAEVVPEVPPAEEEVAPVEGKVEVSPLAKALGKEMVEKVNVLERLGKAKETIKELRQKRTVSEETKAKLVAVIKEHLPLTHQGELLAKVKNVKTEADLAEAITRVELLAEQQSEKTLRADIIKELKKTAPRIEKGITVGRLTPEVQPIIDKLRANLLVGIKGAGGVARNVEAYEAARTKIEQSISDYRDGKITWDALLEANEDLKYTGMYGMSSTQLQEALDYIQEMKRLGKDLRKIKREEIKEQRKEVVDKAVTEVTGGEGIKPGVGTLRNKDIAGTKKVLDQPVNSQYGFVNLLDKLGKFAKGTKQYQGFLMRFANLTQRATNTENMERERTFKIVRDKFREIYNVKKTREATRLLTTLTTEDIDLGTFKITTKEGVKYLPVKLTRAEMMEAYQLYKSPKNLETFKEGMLWTTEIMTKIVNTLTEQDIKWADWLQTEFYDTYYDKINPFYKEEFNIDMPKNPDYVPQSRDFEAKTAETDEVQMLLKDQKRYASVTNKSLKARQENIRPFKFKGVFTVLTNHIIQMEHFMAWAETMHELRSTFGNNEVRTAIRQYHSNDILKRIDDYMNDFARGGVDRVQFLNTLDKLRSNFAVSVLALKPSIGLQQIWTVGAFMTEMKAKDFVTGMANFWQHPIENYKWMMANSTYIKNRYSGGNYERDIRLAQQQGVAKTMSGAGNMSQYLLWQVTQGDKVGVMPGWWAKYQSGLKEGLSQADAMTAADLASERTQNTSELASLSWLQRGSSWGKLLTMFQSQPNKYFRIIADNIRNMQYGRQSKVKGITNLLIVWVILPMLFQWVADAFKFKKEKQARILLLGPLNNILVAGQLIQTAWGWFTDDSFDWQASPVLSTVRDFQNFSSKLMKIIGQIKDPYEDVVMDDIVSALEFFSKGIGQLTGAPTPYLIMVERAIKDGDPRELVFSRWALEEPTPDLQGKTAKIVGQAGQIEGDVTDLTVDKKPQVKDMSKVFSEVKEALSKTLLSDVTEKKGFSPQVVAIAQAIMAQDTLETFSNKRLFEIIDDILGDNTLNYTFSQYYMDYQDRQKITSLAKLKEWDADHPRYNLGNVTPEQFALMRQYEVLETKVEKAQFRKDHPEMDTNRRQDWLKTHPKENALLALHGQADILTKEAYNQFLGLLKTLDIPNDAIPPLTLPPATSIDTHFPYKDMVAQGTHGSWEAQLLLKQDAIKAKDAKVQSYADWTGLKLSDTPIASLELKVKNHINLDLLDSSSKTGYGNPDSPNYLDDKIKDANGLTVRDRAVAKLYADNPTLHDDQRRIEAIEKGTDKVPTLQTVIDAHVAYMKMQDAPGVGPNSATVILTKIDQTGAVPKLNEYGQWRVDNKLDKEPPDFTRIPIWNIDVKYAREDAEYNALPTTGTARVDYLVANDDYRMDRRRREGYQKGFEAGFIEPYVSYYEIPTAGYRRDRFLVTNPTFADAMHRITGLIIPRPEEVPNVAYDDIYDKYETLFNEYEDTNATGKQKLFDENPAFKEGYYRRKAYGALWLDKYVENYVTYTLMSKTGYADERFLKTHMDFYLYAQSMLSQKGEPPWRSALVWNEIPSEEVENLYNEYEDMVKRKVGQVALDDFRAAHLNLDDWLFLVGKVTVKITDKKRREGMTARERAEEAAAGRKIEFDKWVAQMRKRLEAMGK